MHGLTGWGLQDGLELDALPDMLRLERQWLSKLSGEMPSRQSRPSIPYGVPSGAQPTPVPVTGTRPKRQVRFAEPEPTRNEGMRLPKPPPAAPPPKRQRPASFVEGF